MKWSVQFYNEKRQLTARYTVEATQAAAAVSAAERALAAAHPPTPESGRRSLFEQAHRAQADESGWVLYRIGYLPEPADPRVS
jgi:hypothetical protein